MGQVSSSVVFNAVDNLSGPVRGMAGSLGGMVPVVGQVTAALAGIGAAVAGIGTYSVSVAAGFSDAMADVSTMVDTSVNDMGRLSQAVQEMSQEFGQSTEDLGKGLYDTLSAGVGYDESTNFLEQAGKAAIAGASDVKTAVDVGTTAMNAWKIPAEESERVFDIVFAAVKQGKTTFDEFGGGLGQVASLASAMGVEFEEVAGIVAQLTTQGLKTAEAFTGIRATLSGIAAPSEQAKEAAKALGIEFDAATMQSKGLAPFLTDIGTAIDDAMSSADGFPRDLKAVAEAEGDVATASDELAEAVEDGTERLEDASQRVADAADNAARVQTRAQERVGDAYRRVTDAAEEAERAQTKAAENVAKTVRDANERVAEVQERAAERIQSAQERLADAKTPEQMSKAQRDLAQAYEDAQKDIWKAERDGGERIDEAMQRRVETAEQTQRRQEDAQRDYVRAQRDAAEQVGDSQRQVTEAVAAQGAMYEEVVARQNEALMKQAEAEQRLADVRADKAQSAIEVWSQLFGSVEALNGIMGLVGDQAQATSEKLDAMHDSAGNTAEAFKKQSASAGHTLRQMQQEMNAAFRDIGQALLPIVEPIKEMVKAIADELTGPGSGFIGFLKQMVENLKPIIPLLMEMGRSFLEALLPALIELQPSFKELSESMVQLLRDLVEFVKSGAFKALLDAAGWIANLSMKAQSGKLGALGDIIGGVSEIGGDDTLGGIGRIAKGVGGAIMHSIPNSTIAVNMFERGREVTGGRGGPQEVRVNIEARSTPELELSVRRGARAEMMRAGWAPG